MKRASRGFFRARVAITATCILTLALVSSALAAVQGDPFRLGVLNSINSITTLSGNVTSTLLAVTNTNTSTGVAISATNQSPSAPAIQATSNGTGVGSYALRATSKSPSAPAIHATNNSAATGASTIFADGKNPAQSTIISRNTGGGPALDLRVVANKPPMKVSSSALVQNLNADRLDGADSSSFMPRSRYQVILRTFGTNTATGAECGGGGDIRRCEASVACDRGDLLLSGGFDDLHDYTKLDASRPALHGEAWYVHWTSSAVDAEELSLHALCADIAPAHVGTPSQPTSP